MYCDHNFPTKKALKQAIKDGKQLKAFDPAGIFNAILPENGTVFLEGPHYPRPHTWYASATITDGYITKVS